VSENPYEEAGRLDDGTDPIASLHDTEEAQGDDGSLRDVFTLDLAAAAEVGAALDSLDAGESLLD
jgi:hypothetical protein